MPDFHTQGAVPVSSEAYIPRGFEEEVFSEVAAGRWVLLVGPRQQGKTSGLLRISKNLREMGFETTSVDLQRLPVCDSFSDLLRAVTNQLVQNASWSPASVSIPEDTGDFLTWLEANFPNSGPPIVIVIDEAASIRDDAFRNSFFGQIRSISTSAASAEPHALVNRVRFVFAGTFRPEDLVLSHNSPFNVCTRISVEDLSLDQAKELASVVNAELVAHVDQIYAVVSGQPYLLQIIYQRCSEGEGAVTHERVIDVLGRIQNIVRPHLSSIFEKVVASSTLSALIRDVLNLGGINDSPADSNQDFLVILGLLQRTQGQLRFRNELYRRVGISAPQINTGQMAPEVVPVFHIPGSEFAFMSNTHLREFAESSHNGAVASAEKGHFRLALVGLGAAMEALLVDWLAGVTAQNLSSAVSTGASLPQGPDRVSFNNHEDPVNPRTWRLVNLIRVAKALAVGNGSPEPSHSLREWRNEIHPVHSEQSGHTEAHLAPEVQVAGGLFALLLRDIKAVYGHL